MAIAENELFNKMSGRVGQRLFVYTRMGKIIIRRSPGKRKNSSEEQEVSMESFGNRSRLYAHLNDQLGIPVWKLAGRRYGITGNNYFSKVNKGIFREGKFIRDFGELLLTEGELLNPDAMAVEPEGGWTFRVTWTAESSMRSRDKSDRLMVLVLTENRDEYMDIGVAWGEGISGTRGEGTGCFSIPPSLHNFLRKELAKGVPPSLHAYCFFGAADGSAYSKSKHFPLELKEV